MSTEETRLVQAETHLRKAEFLDALRVFREVLERVRDKDPAIEVAALMGMGKVYYAQGDFGLAETCQRDALGIVQATPELHRLCASIMHSIGQVRLMISDPQGAYDHFADAMRLFVDVGDLQGEAGVLLDVGNLFSATRRYEDASMALDRALTLFQQLGDRPRQGDVYLGLGSIHLAQANFSEAFKVYSSARTIFNETGDKAKEGLAINNLGSIRYMEGTRAEGLSLIEQALRIFEELEDKQTQAFILTKLAGLHLQQRELQKAGELARRALQLFREIGHEKGIQVTTAMSQEIEKDMVG
jgi:tetratricopeptide (TPR) repeat protein